MLDNGPGLTSGGQIMAFDQEILRATVLDGNLISYTGGEVTGFTSVRGDTWGFCPCSGAAGSPRAIGTS